jgi:hypothetical protein
LDYNGQAYRPPIPGSKFKPQTQDNRRRVTSSLN